MAIYGKHREPFDPTKIKAKTSKNRTYGVESGSASISGSSVTANPDNNTSAEATQDTTNWYYFSGNAGTGNNTGEDPKQPIAPVPINGGGNYENEIYSFVGGGQERILAYKGTYSGTVTVAFKIIECGGGGGASNVPRSIAMPDGTVYPANNAMGGQSGGFDWMGNITSGQYDPMFRMVHT